MFNNLNADMFEVYRRLAGNPPDMTVVRRGKSMPIELMPRLKPGAIIECDDPKDVYVGFIPWYRRWQYIFYKVGEWGKMEDASDSDKVYVP